MKTSVVSGVGNTFQFDVFSICMVAIKFACSSKEKRSINLRYIMLEKSMLLSLQSFFCVRLMNMAFLFKNGNRSCCVVMLETDSGDELLARTDVCGKTCVHLAVAAGHVDILHDLAIAAPYLCELADHDDRYV